MKTTTQLLEAEIAASKEFTQQNFGLKVGDGFPELVKELCQSKNVPIKLALGALLTALSSGRLADAMAKVSKDGDTGFVVLENLTTFELPLSMLYWGIQIGRKQQAEQATQLESTADSY